MGAMVCYDALVAPLGLAPQCPTPHTARARHSTRRAGASSKVPLNGSSNAARWQAVRFKLLRMAMAAAAVLLYVKARSWLAGEQVRPVAAGAVRR